MPVSAPYNIGHCLLLAKESLLAHETVFCRGLGEPPASFMCGCCFFPSLFCPAKIEAAMTFPLMSRLGAKCVYWSTVMDAEEHKQSCYSEWPYWDCANTEKTFLHSCTPVWKCSTVSPSAPQSGWLLFRFLWSVLEKQISLNCVAVHTSGFITIFFFHECSSGTSSLCYLSAAIFHCLWFCFEHNRPTRRHFTPCSWTFIRAYRDRSQIEREIPQYY